MSSVAEVVIPLLGSPVSMNEGGQQGANHRGLVSFGPVKSQVLNEDIKNGLIAIDGIQYRAIALIDGHPLAAGHPRYVSFSKGQSNEEVNEVQIISNGVDRNTEVVSDGGAAVSQEGGLVGISLWITASTLFGAGIGYFMGGDKASEYFAGYIMEQSLSVDNLLVFVLVFNYFKIDQSGQKKILKYGIIGAAALRAVFVLLGAEALRRYNWVMLIFGAILIYTSLNLLWGDDEEQEEDLSENAVVKFCQSIFDVTPDFDGNNFFARVDGKLMATPMFLSVAVVEISDLIFAVDSIPSVFGITQDPFIVYSSNLFAILSLRQLYTLVNVLVAKLAYLQTSVALALIFIGAKIFLEYFGYDVSTGESLGIVLFLLGSGVFASLLFPPSEE